ncbi:MAG: hypothetical protein ABR557_06170 [Pyrinomonadaceae bacterium]
MKAIAQEEESQGREGGLAPALSWSVAPEKNTSGQTNTRTARELGEELETDTLILPCDNGDKQAEPLHAKSAALTSAGTARTHDYFHHPERQRILTQLQPPFFPPRDKMTTEVPGRTIR